MHSKSLFLIVILLLAGSFWRTVSLSPVQSVPLNTAAPEFVWRGFDAKEHSLKELTGRPVVIHFWATWCAPCREEFPQLLAAAKTLGEDVVFLTVSSDHDKAAAETFIHDAERQAGVKNLPNVLFAFDPKSAVTYGIFQTVLYPESIVLDASHHMRRKLAGEVDWKDKALQNYLHQLKQQ